MFFETLRFELRQQLKSPLFWIIAVVYLAMAFLLAASPVAASVGASGSVWRNAPLVIAKLLNELTVLSLLFVGIFMASAALRDFDHNTAELVFTTPINRRAYLGGRFAAAYVTALIVMLLATLGLVLGSAMPWIDPGQLGPVNAGGYLWAFGVIVLPGMFFIASILFLLASTTRSMLATYIGVIVLLGLFSASHMLMRELDYRFLAALLDPFGYRTIEIATRYWSPHQINHQLPALHGALVYNRLLWVGISVLALGAALALFRAERERWHWPKRNPRQRPTTHASAHDGTTPLALPRVRTHDNLRAHLLQWRRQLVFDTLGVLRGTPFQIILLLVLVGLLASLALGGHFHGSRAWPLSFLVLQTIRANLDFLLALIVIFYAGELTWREHALHLAETSDTLPVPDWVPVLAKLGALVTVIIACFLASAAVGIGWQLSQGFTRIQPGLYLATLALDAVPYVLLAVLTLFLQALCHNKFLGYVPIVLWLVGSKFAAPLLGWHDHLYMYNTAPRALYSDMNGFGRFLHATLWFDLYWSCGALALGVLTALLWPRGTDRAWRRRWRTAAERLRRPARVTLACALLAFIGCGIWIHYNTHVLHHISSRAEVLRQRAHYEKAYGTTRHLPQPRITAMKLNVAIHPYHHRLTIHGRYTLVNKHDVPVRKLQVAFPGYFTVTGVHLVPHTVVSRDTPMRYVVYKLDRPLAPGSSMHFDFTLTYAPRGFTNSPQGLFLAGNGTFFDYAVGSSARAGSLPQLGYQPQYQLTRPHRRRAFGLGPAIPAMAPLGDQEARANDGVSSDADWIHVDTILSTAADQVAVTSGKLVKTWRAHGRRYFHYVTRAPIQNSIPFISARYAVRHAHWKDIPIAIYYDPAHAWDVDRMIRAVKDALAYDSTRFSAYPYHQIRVAEVPYNYGIGAESYPGVLVFRETALDGFIVDERHSHGVDAIYRTVAHEIAHQWWPYQMLDANMRGANMITESLAQYVSMMLVEHRYGAAYMHHILKYALDAYLSGRSRTRTPESPLVDVGDNDQAYIFYNKGTLAFYALQNYVGEEKLDRILARFTREHRFQSPPYVTSREFMHALQQGLGPKRKPLLDDLFRTITLFDDRMLGASAKKLPNGKYAVTMKVHVGMFRTDSHGRETPQAPNIPIPVGVFAASPRAGVDGKALYLAKRNLPAGDSTIAVVVDGKPAVAGIDPYNMLVDRISGDNRAPVTLH